MSEKKDENQPKEAKDASAPASGSTGQPSKAKSGFPFKKKNNNNSQSKPGTSSSTKGKFQGNEKGLEGHIFIFGTGMAAKWITTKEAVLNHIGRTFTMSEVVSIETGTVTVVGFKKPKEWVKKADFENIPFWKQEEWKLQYKKYMEAEGSVTKNLSSCFKLIWGQCTHVLQNKIKTDPKWTTAKNTQDSPLLYKIISSICNRVDTIDDYGMRMVESLMAIIETPNPRGRNIHDYYDLFVERVRAGTVTGVDFATPGFKKHLLDECLKECGDSEDPRYQKFGSQVSQCANDQFLALLFLRQAGEYYEECRRELKNDFLKGSNHYPKTVDEAYHLLQNFEPTKKAQRPTQNAPSDRDGNGKSRPQSGHSYHQDSDFR